MRDTSSRREKIISMLKESGSVQVHVLSEMFDVSTVTIRKDLKFLDRQGIAARSYGGAILNENITPVPERPIEYKQQVHTPEKTAIGHAAAALIQPGDSIILDSGTTTLQIAVHLHDKEDITVVTNGLNVMNELARYPQLNLLMLGGTLRAKNMSFYGVQAENSLSNLHVDKLFLGVDGFHMQRGITTHFEAEAVLNRMMCRVASEIIVVADSSKFSKVCLHQILETSKISKFITDDKIAPDIRKGLEKIGIEVIVTTSTA